MNGTVAKMNLALEWIAELQGRRRGRGRARQAGSRFHRRSIIWSAPSTPRSTASSRRQPYIEATIPTLWDTSLAPAGKHVMSIYMQYAPYKLRDADWDSQRDALGDTIVQALARVRTGSARR